MPWDDALHAETPLGGLKRGVCEDIIGGLEKLQGTDICATFAIPADCLNRIPKVSAHEMFPLQLYERVSEMEEELSNLRALAGKVAELEASIVRQSRLPLPYAEVAQ